MSNVNDFLVAGSDYDVSYGENIDGIGTISCIGIDPWEGTLALTFNIL